MKLVAFLKHFRLAQGDGDAGLKCTPLGVFLAGAPLLRTTPSGFEPRPADELAALAMAAYGGGFDTERLARGLKAAAAALTSGRLELAMTATVHLELPTPSREGATRLATVQAFLAKYDPNEPRDWRGRWTTAGSGGTGPNLRQESHEPSGAATAPRVRQQANEADKPIITPCDGARLQGDDLSSPKPLRATFPTWTRPRC